MANNIVFQKDSSLKIRDLGSPVSGIEYGDSVYITKAKDKVECLLIIPTGSIVLLLATPIIFFFMQCLIQMT